MSVFEITIQHQEQDVWPVVTRHQPGAHALARWGRGRLELDRERLRPLWPTRKEYGTLLGQALFRDEIRVAFGQALALAEGGDKPLRVLLIVEADDLRNLHWEQLCAPLDRGWDYLLLNQGTPFSLYLPSQIQRRFPPIGRRDLRALVLVAGPEELDEDYRLAPFDVASTVHGLRQALADFPCEVLAPVEGASGPPRLDVLCERLTARAASEAYTLLHLVCHGAYLQDSGETILYFPTDEGGRPIQATTLIERFGRLGRLPHLTFLSTCESADPRAEAGLGGLGQRLVRELGMPAVVAMTDRISIVTAEALAAAFYARLGEHGEVDRALCESLVGLQGRDDVTVPALFSRLGGRSLWSDTLDRPLTTAEVGDGLDQMGVLLDERAPVLQAEFEGLAARLRSSLGADPAALSTEARREREAALAALNQLCSQALDLSFNALAVGKPPPTYDRRCPFPGLLAFGARYVASGQEGYDDREFFFGRETLIAQLMEKLAEDNFLPVLGPSGSGKSSLVLAGLVPALQKEEPRLLMSYLTPGEHPLVELEIALKAAEPRGKADSVVLVVDQFEELFTLCPDEDERRTFVDHLLALAEEMQVILTMRADFWGDCAPYPALRKAMQQRQELIAPMDISELRSVTEQQAQKVGLRFEADLGNTMIDAVIGEPGSMPLLQHALLELWKRRHGRWLVAEEYRDGIGGVQQAIAHTADALYSELSSGDQERMREIFLRLTRLGDEIVSGEERRDSRQRVQFEELVPAGSDPAPVRKLVQRLADARLVVTGLWTTAEEGEGLNHGWVKVEVAHEALIHHWPRLQGWLDEDRAELRLREGVRQAALEWDEHERDEAYLIHRGGRLEDTEALASRTRFTLNALEKAYLNACVNLQEREWRELRELTREAQRQARMSRASELAAWASDQLSKTLDLALLLAVEAFRVENLPQTRQALFEVGSYSPLLARFLHQHTSSVESVAWSADGRLASGSHDGTVIIWDMVRGRPAQKLEGHSDKINSVAWSARGRLASGSDDGTVIVWKRKRGRPAKTLKGHSSAVNSVAWSADGRLASGSERDGTVIVWDLERGRPGQALEPFFETVTSAAWSADGRLASGGSVGGTVTIWDLERGRPPQRLERQRQILRVNSLAWSADGQLASGSDDATVTIWDLERGRPAQKLEGHSDKVNSVAWSADGRLASGSDDGTVIVWDLERARPAQTLKGHSRAVNSVAWSADGRLASGSWDGTVIVWVLERSPLVRFLEGHRNWVKSVAWSADGRLASGSLDRTIIVWDLARGRPAQTMKGHTSIVLSAAWSADGRLASGSTEGAVIIWDLEQGRPAQILQGQGHSGAVSSLAWSADGRLASGSTDGTVIIWDLEQGRPAQTLQGLDGADSPAWSADGRLASSSFLGTVIIWDLKRGRPAQKLRGHTSIVLSVAWSADGRLASGSSDGTVIVWKRKRGRPAQMLKGHSGRVNSVAWSADGWLASGSDDGTVIVWDLERGRPGQILEERQKRDTTSVSSVAWSADGRLAASSEGSTTIQVWQMDPEQWIRQACHRAGRNLSQAEWHQYFPDEEYRKTCEQWPAGK